MAEWLDDLDIEPYDLLNDSLRSRYTGLCYLYLLALC